MTFLPLPCSSLPRQLGPAASYHCQVGSIRLVRRPPLAPEAGDRGPMAVGVFGGRDGRRRAPRGPGRSGWTLPHSTRPSGACSAPATWTPPPCGGPLPVISPPGRPLRRPLDALLRLFVGLQSVCALDRCRGSSGHGPAGAGSTAWRYLAREPQPPSRNGQASQTEHTAMSLASAT